MTKKGLTLGNIFGHTPDIDDLFFSGFNHLRIVFFLTGHIEVQSPLIKYMLEMLDPLIGLIREKDHKSITFWDLGSLILHDLNFFDLSK